MATTLILALVASLTLLPGRAVAATGTVLAGSTLTIGNVGFTLQDDCEIDDAASPWSCGPLLQPGTNMTITLFADSITYTSATSFTFEGNVLLGITAPFGVSCTVLFEPSNRSFTLTSTAGTTYTGSFNGLPYTLDACGGLLPSILNTALGGNPSTNPLAFNFAIH